jgi:ABC-2 type transport system ATP-binding protein
MDEAQNLADRVAVLASGRIVAEDAPDMLAGRENGIAVVRFRLPEGADVQELPLPGDVELETANGHISFRTETPTRALTPLLDWASVRGEELEGLSVTRPSLEDVYLELTEESRP